MDPEALYMQLGRLVATMPDLYLEHTADTHQWLARAFALVQAASDASEVARFKAAQHDLNSRDRPTQDFAIGDIGDIVRRALAIAELQAPATVQGAFIPTGNAYDALMAVGKVLEQATRDVLIVDPYMDEKALDDFAVLAPESVLVRLLSDQMTYKPALRPAVQRWASQYGARRPLSVRVAAARILHDRLIMVDGADAWVLTQSLNAFAARSPASIMKADPELARLKILAYQDIWDAAAPLQ